MSPLDVADNNTETKSASSAYVPPLQRTEGQPPPIAAHGGLSYMSFDRDGDAGTAVALEDALAEIAEGEGQRLSLLQMYSRQVVSKIWWLRGTVDAIIGMPKWLEPTGFVLLAPAVCGKIGRMWIGGSSKIARTAEG